MQQNHYSVTNRFALPAWHSFRNVNAAAFALACAICNSAQAQQTPGPDAASTNLPPARLPEVVVRERSDSMLGIADSATQGTVGAAQLSLRPVMRPGEVLETVPGVIITQHAGGGKANQYFLRGFNLDHGTDFATSIDGMPVNLPTHGHGQGYTDLNILIPELVQHVNYRKGVYYAENGDFASAGSADLQLFSVLPESIAHLQGGSFGHFRGLAASSPQVGKGHLLYGLEFMHNDGPWDRPDNFRKANGILRYSQGDASLGWSMTAMGYHGEWDSSDQIASSAVGSGLVGRFGSLDDTTGGDSQRYSLSAEWHRADEKSATKIMAYGFYYDLDLFSNFTYFLTDTNRGDQFEQADKRWVGGVKASQTRFNRWFDRDVENTIGLQFRNDSIHNGLFNSQARRRTQKDTVDDMGAPVTLPARIRSDRVWETSVGPYFENKVQWFEKVRSVAGVRADYYRFDVDSDRAANSGVEDDVIVSPKGSLIFGPWARTELYVEGGLGFHSNDGRGVNSRVDPATPPFTNPVDKADPLVRTYGTEVGFRTLAVPDLQSTLSFWALDIDSELLFVGDAGATEASRPSRRYGVEFANYYTPTKWLTLDADLSLSHARFRDHAPEGDSIPGSIESVVAAGISVHDLNGFFGGLRLRYFGPRPLREDNGFRSNSTILLSGQIGYRFNKTWTVGVEVFNLLDRKDSDIDYAYESRTTPGETVREERHFHPVEPIAARVALTARF